MKRKQMTALMAMAVSFLLAAGSTLIFAAQTEDEAAIEETEADTGDASLDNPRNQDDIGIKEILDVSFVTS